MLAVMLLVGAIGQNAVRGSAIGGEAELEEACSALLDEAVSVLTDSSFDYRKYLYPDWQTRAAGLSAFAEGWEGFSFSITIRLMGEEPHEFPIQGDLGPCLEIMTESEPLLSASAGRCIPGEIIAKVGR